MNLSEIPWTPILFALGQIIAFGIWINNVAKKGESNEREIASLKNRLDNELAEIKKENAELKKELREIRDIVIKVQQNTDLLMLGRIKTGQRNHE